MALPSVQHADARAWLMKVRERVTPPTARNILNVTRCAFEGARDFGLVQENPFRALSVPRSPNGKDPWTVLEPHEQHALLTVAHPPDRWIVGFALGTGMRQGEQWALRASDLRLEGDTGPCVIVRYGTRDDHPTKGGRPRVVPLFGMGLLAIRRHLETWQPNPDGILFPALRGGRRDKKPPHPWVSWLQDAGISRRVRWHDLRHTCAASLASGWWGRAWSLEEISQLLGHASIAITERYAHFSRDVLRRAADETDPSRARVERADLGAWLALTSKDP
jgi:integrase